MKNIFVFFILFSNVLIAQIPEIHKTYGICLTNEKEEWSRERARIAAQIESRSPADFKYVRINFHFMLRSDGTGSFTETGDNLGNAFTGYQFAKDITKEMNWKLSYNSPMNIPPDNTVPANNKNYAFILDAVYFHRNDAWFNFYDAGAAYPIIGADKTEVFNIFLSDDPNSSTAGGYASDLSHDATAPKFTENRNYYRTYQNFRNNIPQGNQYAWVLHGTETNTNHEIGHLLGLSHTVRYNSSTKCPTIAFPFGRAFDPNCDDGCADTPTAWYITDNLNSGRHPACGWVQEKWCSNNMMDYSGNNALTPCQLGIIHAGLDGGLKNYKACEAVKTDKIICSLGFPKLAHFGKKITIGCVPNNEIFNGKKEATIYFSNEVIFNPIEVSDEATLETIFHAACH